MCPGDDYARYYRNGGNDCRPPSPVRRRITLSHPTVKKDPAAANLKAIQNGIELLVAAYELKPYVKGSLKGNVEEMLRQFNALQGSFPKVVDKAVKLAKVKIEKFVNDTTDE